jgi:CHASE3 domain sensor protein
VEKLEKVVESLAELPQRMTALGGRFDRLEGRVGSLELQIVQLRTEMKDGFSAVLEVVESSSQASQQLHDDGRAEMRQLFKENRERLERAIAEGDEATRTQMRVLHEDLVSRIARLGEAPSRDARS